MFSSSQTQWDYAVRIKAAKQTYSLKGNYQVNTKYVDCLYQYRIAAQTEAAISSVVGYGRLRCMLLYDFTMAYVRAYISWNTPDIYI